MSEPVLKVSGLTKSFSGNTVLSDASLEVQPGEIRALVGENGAGKSTLIKLVTGALAPDRGTIIFCGKELNRHTPRTTRRIGIAAVHQELSLCPHLTVAENIFLGIEPRNRLGLIDYPLLFSLADETIRKNGFELDSRAKVSQLPLAQQQVVELIKALATKPRLLILDEATSALGQEQTRVLFDRIRELRREGLTVIVISHRLAEVFEIADRATILKDGQVVGTVGLADATVDQLVKMMVGREISDVYPAKPSFESIEKSPVILSIKGLSSADDRFRDVSFDLHQGEILGIGGLRGQGQKELLAAIFGLHRHIGQVLLNHTELDRADPESSLQQGIAYLPEDRKTQALLLPQFIGFNISLPHLRRLSSKAGTILMGRERAFVSRAITQLAIKARSPLSMVSSLSGGNQQKVALSKLISGNPKVYLLDEPTRGIDVGTRREIYIFLREIARLGAGVVIVSSDTMELIGLCDRVIIMYDHRTAGIFKGREITEENLVRASVAGGHGL